MDLTTPVNLFMWAMGLAAIGFSLHLLWTIVGNRRSASGPVGDSAVLASLHLLEAAFADIDTIERKSRRDKEVELALATAALRRLMSRVDLDQQTRNDCSRIADALGRMR